MAAVSMYSTHFADEEELYVGERKFWNRIGRPTKLYLQKAEHTEGILLPEAIHMLFWLPLLKQNRGKETGRVNPNP